MREFKYHTSIISDDKVCVCQQVGWCCSSLMWMLHRTIYVPTFTCGYELSVLTKILRLQIQMPKKGFFAGCHLSPGIQKKICVALLHFELKGASSDIRSETSRMPLCRGIWNLPGRVRECGWQLPVAVKKQNIWLAICKHIVQTPVWQQTLIFWLMTDKLIWLKVSLRFATSKIETIHWRS